MGFCGICGNCGTTNPSSACRREWAIACLDRVCVNCWCGQSLNDELDGKDD